MAAAALRTALLALITGITVFVPLMLLPWRAPTLAIAQAEDGYDSQDELSAGLLSEPEADPFPVEEPPTATSDPLLDSDPLDPLPDPPAMPREAPDEAILREDPFAEPSEVTPLVVDDRLSELESKLDHFTQLDWVRQLSQLDELSDQLDTIHKEIETVAERLDAARTAARPASPASTEATIRIQRSRQHPQQLRLQIDEAPLDEVLHSLGEVAGVNVLIGNGVTGNVSVSLEGVPVEAAMKQIVESLGYVLISEPPFQLVITAEDAAKRASLTASRENNWQRISPRPQPIALDSKPSVEQPPTTTVEVREAAVPVPMSKPPLPVEMRQFPIRHRPVSEIEVAITPMLTPRLGRLTATTIARTVPSSAPTQCTPPVEPIPVPLPIDPLPPPPAELTVTDRPSVLDAIGIRIKELDQPLPVVTPSTSPPVSISARSTATTKSKLQASPEQIRAAIVDSAEAPTPQPTITPIPEPSPQPAAAKLPQRVSPPQQRTASPALWSRIRNRLDSLR